MTGGIVWNYSKANAYHVWPVKGGSGLSGNPAISASPSSKDFDTVNPGSSSSARTITLTNTGTNNLYITTITLTGTNADQFGVVNGADNCSNKTVAPSGTCTVDAVFSPTASGPMSASLSIASNAPFSPATVSLTGTGQQHTITTSISAGSGTVSCSPNPLDHNNASSCTATPSSGYHITSISGCGGTDPGTQANGAACSYATGAVAADCTVTAAFAINSYTISASVPGGHGTISCQSPVNHGASSVCTITPDPDYYLSSLTTGAGAPVTGSLAKIGGNLTYTFTYITGNLTNVVAAFAAGDHALDLRQNGQTTKYDTRDDGELQTGVAWPVPRFTVNTAVPDSSRSLTDNLTGLVWPKEGGTPTSGACAGGTKSWSAALAYVACLNSTNYLGHNDWRLPNSIELHSIINGEEPESATWLNSSGFANVQPLWYWTSTTLAPDTTYAWGVYFVGGGANIHLKTDSNYVWPVRTGGLANPVIPLAKTGQTTSYASRDDGGLEMGVSLPAPRFTDNKDGTATDSLTGLTWLKNANCLGARPWSIALVLANGLANGACGLTDGSAAGTWRLPNREELASIIDLSRTNPVLPFGHPFGSVPLDLPYWASNTYAFNTTYAWSVSMDLGTVMSYDKRADFYVWPVKGGSGLYGPAGISVSPSPKNFGPVNPGSSSAPQTFAVTNKGTNNLYLTTITIAGANTNQFGKQNDTCSNTTVAPSGTCTLEVTFSPTTGGFKNASLSIPSNVTGSPTKVDLTGTGQQHLITTSVSAGSGSVSCTPNPVTHGLTSSCTTTPAAHYHITSISGCNGTTVGTRPYDAPYAYATGAVTADCTVTAAFAVNTYAITTNSGPTGSISCSPNPVNYNSSTTCTITAAPGFILSTLTDNGADVLGSVSNGSYGIAGVTGIHTVNATFIDPSPPVLTVYTLSNGSVTRNATLNITGSVTSTNNGVKLLTINGTEVTPAGDGSYSYAYSLVPGSNIITVIATDNLNHPRPDRPDHHRHGTGRQQRRQQRPHHRNRHR
jgi:hypothetical protein